ncbi:hypothetical protein PSEUDO9AZ_11422 [Pseudomonas sp. 9AZ]|nr:hypothetical protein PSEUDO9AZ_11422 [Pseudomonas sp. 9AZ]
MLTANTLARNASSWALALPSAGGAVRRIFTRSPCSPANSSLLALGCRWHSRIRSAPSQRKWLIRRSRSDCQTEAFVHASHDRQVADHQHVDQVEEQERDDRRQIQPAHARQNAANWRQQWLADLIDQHGGGVMAALGDPGQNHADDQGEEEHLEEQCSDANDRPHQQLQRVLQAITKEHQGECHQHELHQNGQHQRGQIKPGDAWNHLAQRFQQRMGGAHNELAERVVEVCTYQLQDKTQQHDQQVEAANGLQDVDGGGIESDHFRSLLTELFGELGRAVGGGIQGFLDQGFETVSLEGLDRSLGGASR